MKQEDKNNDCMIISRDYLNYSKDGSEKTIIKIINRDYNTDNLLNQIRRLM